MTEDGRQMAEGRKAMKKYEIIKSVEDLVVYRESYALAMDIFELTRKFPKEEMYSLTDQIRKSSRSVPMNIREGYAKKRYSQVFIRHLVDALGSNEETRGWLKIAYDCGYLNREILQKFDECADTISAMLYKLSNTWKDF